LGIKKQNEKKYHCAKYATKMRKKFNKKPLLIKYHQQRLFCTKKCLNNNKNKRKIAIIVAIWATNHLNIVLTGVVDYGICWMWS